MAKKKKDYLPGAGLGVPMYHALTGNLPIISPELHHPLIGGVTITTATSENTPNTNDDLQPGWIELTDVFTKKKFWWNVHYRSRREKRPIPSDDGKKGAGKGERDSSAIVALRRAKLRALVEGKTWEEKYDKINSRVYYWNRKLNTTQWERPSNFYEDGVGYRSIWLEKLDPKSGECTYVNRVTGKTVHELPDDFDGMPSTLTWELGEDGVWTNWITNEKSRTKPASLSTNAANLPTEAPPAPPSMEDDLDLFIDDDDEEIAAGAESDDEDEDDQGIIFTAMEGPLKKRGGGYSFMGSKNWKERYFVARDGILAYYETEARAKHTSAEPLKGVRLNLRYYGVDPIPDDPLRFNLVPKVDAFVAFTNAGGEGVPPPDRVFELEAPNPDAKQRWVSACKGRLTGGGSFYISQTPVAKSPTAKSTMPSLPSIRSTKTLPTTTSVVVPSTSNVNSNVNPSSSSTAISPSSSATNNKSVSFAPPPPSSTSLPAPPPPNSLAATFGSPPPPPPPPPSATESPSSSKKEKKDKKEKRSISTEE